MPKFNVTIPGLFADNVAESYKEMNFYRGIAEIMGALHGANKFFEDSKPWELKKHPDKQRHLDAVLHLTMETLRIAGDNSVMRSFKRWIFVLTVNAIVYVFLVKKVLYCRLLASKTMQIGISQVSHLLRLYLHCRTGFWIN